MFQIVKVDFESPQANDSPSSLYDSAVIGSREFKSHKLLLCEMQLGPCIVALGIPDRRRTAIRLQTCHVAASQRFQETQQLCYLNI